MILKIGRVYFVCVNFFFSSSSSFLMISGRLIISGSSGVWTDFRNLFTEWKRFGCRWLIWTSYFDISRNVAMATNLGKNGKLPTFVTLAFRNGMGYRYLNVRVNSANNACISCENFVKFGLVTPELTGLICERLVWHGQKLAYFAEYLRIYWTDYCNLYTIWKRFTCRWTCTLFSNLSRDVAMAAN